MPVHIGTLLHGKCDEGYTYDEVMNKLLLNGIKTGIDEEKIRWMISQKIYDQPVEIAVGKPVNTGKDGYYEFFFDTDAINNNRPTVREDGSVDYFNQKRFEKVNEGDLLARYHEPTKGEFGFDICGKLLVPKPGKPKPRLPVILTSPLKSILPILTSRLPLTSYTLTTLKS